MERGAREGDTRTSLDKLDEINRLCKELGVDTAPACVENVWLVPISSWYHASFDRYTSLSFVHSLSLSLTLLTPLSRFSFSQATGVGGRSSGHQGDDRFQGLPLASVGGPSRR